MMHRALALAALATLSTAVVSSSACKPPGERGRGHKAAASNGFQPPKPVPISDTQLVNDLKAENAELRYELDNGKTERITGLINAHEHLYHAKDLDKYLPAAHRAGVAMTVILASSDLTNRGRGGNPGEPSMSVNFETQVLEAAKEHPGEIIPFATLDPKDPNKLETLKKHVEMGAKGLKLYSGHTNFYTIPLDDPSMDPVYSYLEQIHLPVLWHVHYPKYADELDHVVEKHPNMNLLLPHYGVCFWRANDGCIERLTRLMRAHKNLFVDVSLGTRQILTDGFAAMEPQLDTYRKFIDEFQDRITWGTDTVITQNYEKTPAWFEKVMFASRDQLEKASFTTDLAAAYSKYHPKGRDGDGRFKGFALPPEILHKIYIDNPRKWLHLPPAPAATSTPPSTPPAPAAPAAPATPAK